MKELTSYNRVAGYLNKLFDLLNAEFFESAHPAHENISARPVAILSEQQKTSI